MTDHFNKGGDNVRKPIIGGNWKMYKTISEGVNVAKELVNSLQNLTECDVFICPPFTMLEKIREIIKNSPVKLAAQNMHWEDEGAFTGETSGKMLLDAGCTYVLLGHSERRRGEPQENDEIVNKKLKKALSIGLIPVVCIGETKEERKAGHTEEIIKKQITGSLKEISENDMLNIVIAYEPVWAIGTGETATPEQAEEVHIYIRNLLSNLYNADVADKIRIQYGGSVKPDNMSELIMKKNIDGGLVGGASLKAESLVKIVNSCKSYLA